MGRGLPPDRAEQFLVLVGDFRKVVVERVGHRHRRHFAEQDHSAFVVEEGVRLVQPSHPGGHGRSGECAFGGQSAPDEGVQDGQRQFHGVPVRPGGVEERTDGLLRQSDVPVGGERDDRSAGYLGGVERQEHFVPLPGVHGEIEVRVRVEAAGAEHGGEAVTCRGVEFGAVELLGRLERGDAPVGREVGADRYPGEPGGGAGLGCPAGGVGGREARAALVEDEPGVAGLVAFEFRVVEVGELGAVNAVPSILASATRVAFSSRTRWPRVAPSIARVRRARTRKRRGSRKGSPACSTESGSTRQLP